MVSAYARTREDEHRVEQLTLMKEPENLPGIDG